MLEWLLYYAWVVGIIITIMRAFMWRFTGKAYIEKNPELLEGYKKYSKNFVLLECTPWIIMGICSQCDNLTFFDFVFYKNTESLFVVFFLASLLLMTLFEFKWLFFRGGAEIIVKHPGLFGINFTKARVLKTAHCFAASCGVDGYVWLYRIGMCGLFEQLDRI